MEWITFDDGKSIGQIGSENGVILRDEEHQRGARITLERDCGRIPFAITCGVYGWMFHTLFLSAQQDAEAEYSAMKDALDEIIKLIPTEADSDVDEKMTQVHDSISEFVKRYR